MQKERATLTSIAGGQAVQLFDRELDKVLLNIADDSVRASGVRKITLEFTFTPDEMRHATMVRVAAKSTLTKSPDAAGLVYIGENEGEIGAFNSDPKQLTLAEQLGSAMERKA